MVNIALPIILGVIGLLVLYWIFFGEKKAREKFENVRGSLPREGEKEKKI